jgi:hypothetical protein
MVTKYIMEKCFSVLGSSRNFCFFHSLEGSLLILSYLAGQFPRQEVLRYKEFIENAWTNFKSVFLSLKQRKEFV